MDAAVPSFGSGRSDPSATRARLLEAGASLLDDLPFERLLAGVSTAAIASSAGVTTGSFFHHFPNATAFTEELVKAFSAQEPLARTGADLARTQVDDEDVIVLLRERTIESWRMLTTDPHAQRWFRLHLHMAAHNRASLPGAPDPDDPSAEEDHGDGEDAAWTQPRTVGDLLAIGYRRREAASLALWESLLDRAGIRPAEPFDRVRATRALNAVLDGLLLRHAVDPDAIDEELFSDLCTIVTRAITTPSELRRLTEDLVELVANEDRSPQARSGARRRRASRERIARGAVGMFTEGWERVSASDVAARADVVPQTVLNLFGSTRGVAALTFGRHVPELRASVEQLPDDASPLDKVRTLVVRLAELAATEPEPARALLEERMVTLMHVGEELRDPDVRLEVPLGELFIPPLTELGLGPSEVVDLAATLINFTLVHALPGSGSAEDTAELALRLVPETEPSAVGAPADVG